MVNFRSRSLIARFNEWSVLRWEKDTIWCWRLIFIRTYYVLNEWMNEWMNEYDLNDAFTELLQGHWTKLSSKTALSVSEEMTQWTGESLDVDRRMPAMTWTEHWVARNSRHMQRPQGTHGRREWMVRQVLTYSRIWVGDERPLRWISEVSQRGMTVPDHAGTRTLGHTTSTGFSPELSANEVRG